MYALRQYTCGTDQGTSGKPCQVGCADWQCSFLFHVVRCQLAQGVDVLSAAHAFHNKLCSLHALDKNLRK